jgi:hypothetical protein
MTVHDKVERICIIIHYINVNTVIQLYRLLYSGYCITDTKVLAKVSLGTVYFTAH